MVEEKNLLVVVDSKEYSKTPEIARSLDNCGVLVLVENLPADYVIPGEPGCIVERKTCIDFVKSVIDKRLFEQLKSIKAQEEYHPLLIVEGSMAKVRKFTKWNESSIVAIANSIMFDWKVPIFFSPSKKYTILCLLDLAKRTKRKKKVVFPLRFKPKTRSIEDKARFIIEGLPGISGKRAVDILQHFGSVEGVFRNIDRIDDVPGIGEKTKKEIVEVVRWKIGE